MIGLILIGIFFSSLPIYAFWYYQIRSPSTKERLKRNIAERTSIERAVKSQRADPLKAKARLDEIDARIGELKLQENIIRSKPIRRYQGLARFIPSLRYDRLVLFAQGHAAIFEVERHQLFDAYDAEESSLPDYGRRRYVWALLTTLFFFGLFFAPLWFKLPLAGALIVPFFPAAILGMLAAWWAPMPFRYWLFRRYQDEKGATKVEQITRAEADKLRSYQVPILDQKSMMPIKGPGGEILQEIRFFPTPKYSAQAKKMDDERESLSSPSEKTQKIELAMMAVLVVGLFVSTGFFAVAWQNNNKAPVQIVTSEADPNSQPLLSALPLPGAAFNIQQAKAILSYSDDTLKARGFTADELDILRNVVFNGAEIPAQYRGK